jgi:hypothetical protein
MVMVVVVVVDVVVVVVVVVVVYIVVVSEIQQSEYDSFCCADLFAEELTMSYCEEQRNLLVMDVSL